MNQTGLDASSITLERIQEPWYYFIQNQLRDLLEFQLVLIADSIQLNHMGKLFPVEGPTFFPIDNLCELSMTRGNMKTKFSVRRAGAPMQLGQPLSEYDRIRRLFSDFTKLC